ncbi:hypothetical protein LB505_012381 [Fusarium chuoi]|nr:hypothetical protein LB505_012381 [Fusarium chuoi]
MELADRLGRLTGKPESSTLHVHPLQNFNPDEEKHINTITTDQAANPAEDLWKNRPADIRNSWHTDAGYEPNPPDYSILKLRRRDSNYTPSHEDLQTTWVIHSQQHIQSFVPTPSRAGKVSLQLAITARVSMTLHLMKANAF